MDRFSQHHALVGELRSLGQQVGAIRKSCEAKKLGGLVDDVDQALASIARMVTGLNAAPLQVKAPPGCIDIGARRFHCSMADGAWLGGLIDWLQRARAIRVDRLAAGARPFGEIEQSHLISAMEELPEEKPVIGFQVRFDRKKQRGNYPPGRM